MRVARTGPSEIDNSVSEIQHLAAEKAASYAVTRSNYCYVSAPKATTCQVIEMQASSLLAVRSLL